MNVVHFRVEDGGSKLGFALRTGAGEGATAQPVRDNPAMSTQRSYHHGNLREAALEAAHATVAAQGHDAVSMRELALQLGVAPSALYRHYGNRTALLLALANAMHETLGSDLAQVLQAHGDPWECLEMACVRFLDFAQANDRMFRMMYDDEVINAPDAEAHLPALRHNYDLMLGLVQQARPDLGRREARLHLIGLWSTLFGFASVRAHGALKSYMLQGVSAQAMQQSVVRAAIGPRPG